MLNASKRVDKTNMTKIKNIDIEQLLERKATENAKVFSVPEGYFDSLQERVMANIDDGSQIPQKAKIVSLIPWKRMRWIAACACVLIVGITATLQIAKNSDVTESNDIQATLYHTDAMTDAATYTMMDTQEMYSILAGDDF